MPPAAPSSGCELLTVEQSDCVESLESGRWHTIFRPSLTHLTNGFYRLASKPTARLVDDTVKRLIVILIDCKGDVGCDVLGCPGQRFTDPPCRARVVQRNFQLFEFLLKLPTHISGSEKHSHLAVGNALFA